MRTTRTLSISLPPAQFRAVERDLRNERRQQREAKAKAALSTKEGKHKAALKREVETE